MSNDTEIFRTNPTYVNTVRAVILIAMGILCVCNYILLHGFNIIGLLPLIAAGIAMFNIEHKVVLTADTVSIRRGIYHKVYPIPGTDFRVAPVIGPLSFLFSLRSSTPALYVTPRGGSEKRFMLIIPNEAAGTLATSLQRRTRAIATAAGG